MTTSLASLRRKRGLKVGAGTPGCATVVLSTEDSVDEDGFALLPLLLWDMLKKNECSNGDDRTPRWDSLAGAPRATRLRASHSKLGTAGEVEREDATELLPPVLPNLNASPL